MVEKSTQLISDKINAKSLLPFSNYTLSSNQSTKFGLPQLSTQQIKLNQNDSCDFDSNEHLEDIMNLEESETSVDNLMHSITHNFKRNILHTTTGLTATKGLNDRFKMKSLQDATKPKTIQEGKQSFSQTLQELNNQSYKQTEVNQKTNFPQLQDIELINELQEYPNNSTTEIQQNMVWNLMFSPSYNLELYQKHLMITCKGLMYANKCLRGPSGHYLKSKQITLGPPKFKTNNKTLFFDLDETLVHSCSLQEVRQSLNQPNSQIVGINIRPYCAYLLEKLSEFYEIYLFTASSSQYATLVCSFLDPQNKYISGVLSRQNCMQTKNGFFIKDLRIIKNRDLQNMLIIDNLAHSFGLQIDNGIPICEWYEDLQDEELKYLTGYLLSICFEKSLLAVNREKLGLRKFISEVEKNGNQSLSP